MDVDNLKKCFAGGMIGSALGDAIGELVLYKAAMGSISIKDIDQSTSGKDLLAATTEAKQLKYTDDTAMAIGLAEALIAKSRVDKQYIGDRFRVNYDREPWRGYAAGPPAIFMLVEQSGLSYAEVSRKVGEALYGPQGSYGNGAAMRIIPVGLFYYNEPDMYSLVEGSALPTHTHPIAADGAAVLAKAVAMVVQMTPRQPIDQKAFCHRLINFARTPEIAEKMKMTLVLLSKGASDSDAADALGRGETTHESVPFAIYSFLKTPMSFVDCLLCAVTNGGDCDTLGAMACGISGTYLGVDAIPKEWVDKLENKSYIEKLARWLFVKKTGVDEEVYEIRNVKEKWDSEQLQLIHGLVEELGDPSDDRPALGKD